MTTGMAEENVQLEGKERNMKELKEYELPKRRHSTEATKFPRVTRASWQESLNLSILKDQKGLMQWKDPLFDSANTSVYKSIRKTLSMADLYEVDDNLGRKYRSMEFLSERHKIIRGFFYPTSHRAFSNQQPLVRELIFKRSFNEYQYNQMNLESKKKLSKKFKKRKGK